MSIAGRSVGLGNRTGRNGMLQPLYSGVIHELVAETLAGERMSTP